MSKKGNDANFNTRACRKFKDNQKIDLISQEEIFDILEEDTSTILQQITNFRNHVGGAKYPTYTGQMFANLSVPYFYYRFVKSHVKKSSGKKGKLKTDLSDDEIESLKTMLSDAYKRSAANQFANQPQEYGERNKLLAKTFEILDPEHKKIAKKLKLSKSETRDLLIQVYGDPVRNMRYVHKLFNDSALSDKKKLKIMKKLYGDRFEAAVGAAMTVENNNSDCLAMLYEYMMSLKLKKRAQIVRAYADAYKERKAHYFRINAEFKYKNRKLIRELKRLDIGYKKAFKNLKGDSPKKKKKEKKEKDRAEEIRSYIKKEAAQKN